MAYHKYSPVVARWSLLKGTTDKRYRRNVKILIARGLWPELARATAGKICRGEIQNHSVYVQKLADNLNNIDSAFLHHTGAFDFPQMSEDERKRHNEIMIEEGYLLDREEAAKHTTSFRERVKERMRNEEAVQHCRHR